LICFREAKDVWFPAVVAGTFAASGLRTRGAHRDQLDTGEGDPGITQKVEAVVFTLFGHFHLSNLAGGS
jgi:hypothetical protein